MYKCQRVDAAQSREWDAVVQQLGIDSPFMSSAWKHFLECVFAYQPAYYFLMSGARVAGIAPFFRVRSWIYGSRYVSLPFADDAGVHFFPDVPDAEKCALLRRLCATLLSGKKNMFLEIRSVACVPAGLGDLPSTVTNPYVTFRLNRRSAETPRLAHSLRQHITRARSVLRVRWCERREDMAQVYALYVRQMRKFGSPPLPLAYFLSAWDILRPAGHYAVLGAYDGERMVAAMSVLFGRRSVYAELNMSDSAYDGCFPKTLLFYEAIRDAWSRGAEIFDFGRTRYGSGVYEHKRRWRGTPERIQYTFIHPGIKKIACHDPAQRRYHIPQMVFKYAPQSVSRICGPHIRKHLAK